MSSAVNARSWAPAGPTTESACGELLAQLAHPEPEAHRTGNLGNGSKETRQVADLDILDPDDLAGRLARRFDGETRPAGEHRANFLDLAVTHVGTVVPGATSDPHLVGESQRAVTGGGGELRTDRCWVAIGVDLNLGGGDPRLMALPVDERIPDDPSRSIEGLGDGKSHVGHAMTVWRRRALCHPGRSGWAWHLPLAQTARVTADRPALLLAQDLGYTVGEDGTMTPTVVLHVDDHPEVADLARVHAIEGIGDVRTTGRRVDNAGPDGAPIFLLGVSLTSPVRAAFAIMFPLPDAEAFLRDAGRGGRLALATTDVGSVGAERPFWLAIDLDGRSLEQALDVI